MDGTRLLSPPAQTLLAYEYRMLTGFVLDPLVHFLFFVFYFLDSFFSVNKVETSSNPSSADVSVEPTYPQRIPTRPPPNYTFSYNRPHPFTHVPPACPSHEIRRRRFDNQPHHASSVV